MKYNVIFVSGIVFAVLTAISLFFMFRLMKKLDKKTAPTDIFEFIPPGCWWSALRTFLLMAAAVMLLTTAAFGYSCSSCNGYIDADCVICPSCGALQEDRLSEEVDCFSVDDIAISSQKATVGKGVLSHTENIEVYDVTVILENGTADTLSIESGKCMIVPCEEGRANEISVRAMEGQSGYFFVLRLTEEMMEQVQERQKLSAYRN